MKGSKHHTSGVLIKALPVLIFALSGLSEAIATPIRNTVTFARRDSCDLKMDIYTPARESDKPIILFMFGGGFVSGKRDAKYYLDWFDALVEEGYPVVSIDYRLGLKGVKMRKSPKYIDVLEHAISIAVEDLFSATNHILQNAGSLGLGGRRIVVAGSSAGAISVLQAEYEIACGRPLAKVLPKGFNYAGVISFSGAVLSRNGRIRYKTEPCPQMLLHGNCDRIVPYTQIKILNLCFGGSSHLAESLKRQGSNYQMWRFDGNYHEIAGSMLCNLPRELEFLKHNVERGERIIIDATVTDSTIPIPDYSRLSTNDLYK